MKQALLTTITLLAFCSGWSQLVIDNTETPEALILNTFLGQNMTISNVTFNGTAANAQTIHDQIARYLNGTAGLSSASGLILATGQAIVAEGPNDEGSATMPTLTPFTGDADLTELIFAFGQAGQVNNSCIVEFDFIPNGNTVLFEYIFASEEWPAYANSNFNDVFGLFLSGPGIAGPFSNEAINIATIPGTSLAVSINNLNNGNTNTGPCEYCEFYVSNGLGSTPMVNPEVQYNSYSTELTASGAVSPGQVYHLKFAVANVGDNSLDSAMFLTAGSFRSMLILGNESFAAQKVEMYPNPATDMINISAADAISKVTIYDLQGRILKSVHIAAGEARIDIESLSTGTYVVAFVLANSSSSTQKLVVR